MGKVTKSLVVCATPRSGSTLLCALLEGTGIAGRPQEFFEQLSHSGLPRQPREYFEGVDDEAILALLAPTDPGEPDRSDPRPRALEEGTTPNGVFAAKLMWTHLLDLAERLGRPADADLLGAPDPHYVHVCRGDKVAQAVSLWRAVQTREWRAGAVMERGHAVYHGGAIAHLAAQLEAQDEAWRDWFADHGIEPLHHPLRGPRRGHHRRHVGGARPPRRRPGRDPGAAVAAPGRRPLRPLGRARTGGGGGVSVSELDRLEAESIHVMREVAAELERPVLMFSGGKDSIVLLRLAEKAFRPGALPFPILHVDTGHNFPEVLEFRDRLVEQLGERLIVASVQEAIDAGRVKEEGPSRNRLQTAVLLEAIEDHRFDAAFGGARRDEERARAKERVFSFRDEFGQWDPRAQRPEVWNLFNGRVRGGEHVRVFPLSSWTELDVWHYIQREELELPSIYLAHDRRVFERDGMLLAESEWLEPGTGEDVFEETVRYRTVGDMTVTGAVRSEATELEDVIAEIATTTVSERGETRADDRVSSAAMEDRKREGYF